MIVDTHAHLDLPEFAADLPETVERAAAADVGRIVTVGIDLQSSSRAVELAERFPAVWAAAGVHPHDAASWTEDTRLGIADLLAHPKVVAVGETGLDFYRDRSPRDAQDQVFRAQLRLARDRGLPVIIHSREANPETLRILREEGPGVEGVMHCFAGSLDEARACIELGMFISIAGPVTYPNAAALREVVAGLPIERLLVETDSPYLPPQGKRGERNEPAYTVETVRRIAEITGFSAEDVARITSDNARVLFGLDLEVNHGAVAYRIRRSLYLNITNRCQNTCTFCGRLHSRRVKGHHLKLDHEPDLAEVLAAIAAERDYDEVVFCGFGESLLRLSLVREIAAILKARGIRVRVNTNGLASSHFHRPVAEELRGLVDAWSVSLNAQDAATYVRLSRPGIGPEAWQAVVDFVREAVGTGAAVTATAVELPGVDIEACRAIAVSLGAAFGIRKYTEVR